MTRVIFGGAVPATLAFAVILGSASTVHAQNSFEMPREQILAKVHRVGLIPVTLGDEFKERSDVKARYEQLLAERLQKLGWEVVPSARYDEVLLQLKREIGGYYDPFTGEVSVEKRDAVSEHAQREFFRLHRLDASLSPAIRRVSAYWSHNSAFWHGVEESSTGKDGFWAAMNSPGATGTIPALSLVVALFGADDKMMYGRLGGIQLASYVGQGGVGGFSDIPAELLLRDPIRDARAADLALEPLLKTPEQIRAQQEAEKSRKRGNKPKRESKKAGNAEGAAANAPPPLAPKPAAVVVPAASAVQALKQPREQILANVKVIALVPLDLKKLDQAAAVSARYEANLTGKLTAAGFTVVPAARYGTERDAFVKQLGGTFDPITGEEMGERVASTRRHVLGVLDAERRVDAILTPEIVPRPADFRGGDATWDGVKQNAAGLKGLAAFFGTTGEYGRVPALSLEVTLSDREGVELYRDFGGIHLLRKQDRGRLVDLEETELFHDTGRDERAAHVALRALLLDPEALYVDIHGRKPERE